MFSVKSLIQLVQGQRAKKAVNQPLISETEFQQLIADIVSAEKTTTLSSESNLMSTVKSLGPQLSFYRGPGMEFVENREYLSGDDIRNINWRMSARFDRLHSKVYTEDKQQQVLILNDRRASMRFGSIKKLKVTQAAIVSTIIAIKAYCRNCSVAIFNVEPNHELCQFSSELNQISFNLSKTIKPCPPINIEYAMPSLSEAIELSQTKYGKGNIVFIVSDFIDFLQSENDVLDSSFARFAQYNRINPIHIVDPAEMILPDVGQLSLCSANLQASIKINTADNNLRQNYQDQSLKLLKSIKQRLKIYSSTYIQIKTNDNADSKLATCL